ncbi:MAG: ferritin family protein [Patescibacteria group bacterium]|nr:ferritin family protein [Patescibacteria group bacterium]
MMSQIPINLAKVNQDAVDREILRAGLIAELDAVNLYEQMAELAQSDKVKAVLQDIAKEEKTHVGEFQALLVRLDEEQAAELIKGEKEVKELTE